MRNPTSILKAAIVAATAAITQPALAQLGPPDIQALDAMDRAHGNDRLFSKVADEAAVIVDGKTITIQWAGELSQDSSRLLDVRVREPQNPYTFIAYSPAPYNQPNVEILSPEGYPYVLEDGTVMGNPEGNHVPTQADFKRGAELLNDLQTTSVYMKAIGYHGGAKPEDTSVTIKGCLFKVVADKADLGRPQLPDPSGKPALKPQH